MNRRELIIELKIRALLLGARVLGSLAGPPHRASVWCGRRAAYWMKVLTPLRDKDRPEEWN